MSLSLARFLALLIQRQGSGRGPRSSPVRLPPGAQKDPTCSLAQVAVEILKYNKSKIQKSKLQKFQMCSGASCYRNPKIPKREHPEDEHP